MCAIAGILFKNGRRGDINLSTGEALTRILDATLHRGPDSAGWALYREPVAGQLRLRYGEGEDDAFGPAFRRPPSGFPCSTKDDGV